MCMDTEIGNKHVQFFIGVVTTEFVIAGLH